MMIGSRLRALSLGLVAGATLATSPGPFGPETALAESALLLPYPTSYKVFPASTYDKKGKRLGAAELSLERLDGGGVRIGIQCGAESGARTVAHAELGPAAGGSGLRLLREQSQSYDERGRPLVLLRIDHANGKATCTPPPGAKDDRIEVDLPNGERRSIQHAKPARVKSFRITGLTQAEAQLWLDIYEATEGIKLVILVDDESKTYPTIMNKVLPKSRELNNFSVDLEFVEIKL